MATDPVCGMTVDERTAAVSVVHAGQTWYFCSPRCQHEYEAKPAQYAVSGKAGAMAMSRSISTRESDTMKRQYPVPHRHRGAAQVNLVVLAFFAIAAFFLLTEHRAHLFGALPFLLVLACPLLHSYLHRGHDGKSEHQPPGKEGGKT